MAPPIFINLNITIVFTILYGFYIVIIFVIIWL